MARNLRSAGVRDVKRHRVGKGIAFGGPAGVEKFVKLLEKDRFIKKLASVRNPNRK